MNTVRNSLQGDCANNIPREQYLWTWCHCAVARYSLRFRPGDRFCEPNFRHLSPGIKGEKCRPKQDHMRRIPLTHSAQYIISCNFYIQLFQFTLADQSFKRTRHPQSSCNLIHLKTLIFLSSKWLAIRDLRCMDEALLILLIVIH